jgi:hypothetical protein
LAKPTPPSPTPLTATDLTAGEWQERFAALARLPIDEPVPEEFHAALVGLLSAPKASQRAKAVSAVVRAGAPVVPLVLAVLTEVEPEGVDTRRAAVVALGQLGPAARPAVEVLRELADDPWLGACAQSALAAIEPPRSGLYLLCTTIAIAALLTVASLTAPANGVGPIAVLSGFVGLCVAFGLWWTRPGAAGVVCVFVVGLALAGTVWMTGGFTNVFTELSHVLARR